MLFPNFPFTTFDEKNLDWIIKTLKEVITALDSLEGWKAQFEDEYNEIKQFYDDLKAGIIPPDLENSLKLWVQQNAVTIVGEMVKMVYFTCNDAGYLVAHVPDSWQGITFGTTGLDKVIAGYGYGHLYISY